MQQYRPLHERSHAHPRQSLTARATAASKVIGLLGGQLEVYGRGGGVGVPMRRDGPMFPPRRHLAENCETLALTPA